MKNNLHPFKKSIASIEKMLKELEQNNIGIKGIIINDAGRPSFLVYNDEKLKKLIKNKSAIMVRMDSAKPKEDNFVVLNDCRLIWSNTFN